MDRNERWIWFAGMIRKSGTVAYSRGINYAAHFMIICEVFFDRENIIHLTIFFFLNTTWAIDPMYSRLPF